MEKVLVSFLGFLAVAHAAKILGVFMTPSYSHQLVFQPIWKELSLRGHQVTIYTPNPLNDPSLTNLTEYDLGFSYEVWANQSLSKGCTRKYTAREEYDSLFNAYMATSEAQLEHPYMQKLIRNEDNETYDLFLVEFLWPTMYAIKDVYNVPMVGITSLGIALGTYDIIGLPQHPALDPEIVLPFATDLTFKERVISTSYHLVSNIMKKVKMRPRLNAFIRKHFGEDSRELTAITKDVSLVIVNSNLALHNVKPMLPVVVDISGIHLQEPKPLSQDLKTFLDSATNGVVYFSLGTNVDLSGNFEKTKIILQALNQIPYKVLWKFDADQLPYVPSNIYVKKWLPQQSVLNHINTKLFITQGGLQSLDEAINSKTPMVMMPVFADQIHNADMMVKSGVALSVDLHDFTKEELVEKIMTVIEDPTFKKNVTKLAAIASDQPIPPLEKAVWWIEYVLRHNGAKHLRYKSLDLSFFQYYMFDVYLFMISVLASAIFVLYTLYRTLVKLYASLDKYSNRLRSKND